MNNKIEIRLIYFKKQCKQLKFTVKYQWIVFKPSEKLVKNYIINYVTMLTVKMRWKCYVKDQKLYTEICCSEIKKFITKGCIDREGKTGESNDLLCVYFTYSFCLKTGSYYQNIFFVMNFFIAEQHISVYNFWSFT